MNDRTTTPATPRPSAAEVQRLIAGELGLPSRLAHTALLLLGLGAAGVTGALLLTEAGLPDRTRIAFAVMVGIGLSWAVFATWVLARRRVLLARHRIVAARMAVAFTALFTVGALALGRSSDARLAAAGVGITMLALAIVLLVRARRQFDALSRRRRELEAQLGDAGVRS